MYSNTLAKIFGAPNVWSLLDLFSYIRQKFSRRTSIEPQFSVCGCFEIHSAAIPPFTALGIFFRFTGMVPVETVKPLTLWIALSMLQHPKINSMFEKKNSPALSSFWTKENYEQKSVAFLLQILGVNRSKYFSGQWIEYWYVLYLGSVWFYSTKYT